MSSGKISGGCQCGAIRYTLSKAPNLVYTCHCSNCRRISSSAFNVSCIVDEEAFQLEQGELVRIEWIVNNNLKRYGEFCPDCGVRIRHGSDPNDGIYAVRGGTLDDQKYAQPVAHIWLSSAAVWFIPPADDLCFETQPDNNSEIEALYKKRFGDLA